MVLDSILPHLSPPANGGAPLTHWHPYTRRMHHASSILPATIQAPTHRATLSSCVDLRTGPPSTPKGHGGYRVLMVGHGRSCERPGTPMNMLREAARVKFGAGAAC